MDVKNISTPIVVGSNTASSIGTGETGSEVDLILAELNLSRTSDIKEALDHAMTALALTNQKIPRDQRDTPERLAVIQNIIDILNEHPDTELTISSLYFLYGQVDLPEHKKYLQLEIALYLANHSEYEIAIQEYQYLIDQERENLGKPAPMLDYFIRANLGLIATHIRYGHINEAKIEITNLTNHVNCISEESRTDVINQLRTIGKALKEGRELEPALTCIKKAEQLINHPLEEIVLVKKLANEHGEILKSQGNHTDYNRHYSDVLDIFNIHRRIATSGQQLIEIDDFIFDCQLKLVEAGKYELIPEMEEHVRRIGHATMETPELFEYNEKRFQLVDAYVTSGNYQKAQILLKEIARSMDEITPDSILLLLRNTPECFLKEFARELKLLQHNIQGRNSVKAHDVSIRVCAIQLLIAINSDESTLAKQFINKLLLLANQSPDTNITVGLLCSYLTYASSNLSNDQKIDLLSSRADDPKISIEERVILHSTLAEFCLMAKDPSFATENLNLARSYLRTVKAKLSIDPDYGMLYLKLAKIHISFGENTSAIKLLSSFITRRDRAGLNREPAYLKALELLSELHSESNPVQSNGYRNRAENLRKYLEKLNDGCFFWDRRL